MSHNNSFFNSAIKVRTRELLLRLQAAKALRRLNRQYFVPVPSSRPVFIASYPRSGSSLLMGIISASGRCFMLDETGIVFRCLKDSVLRMLLEKKYGKALSSKPVRASAEYAAKDRIAREIAFSKSGTTRWGDKTTENCLYIPFIFRIFPNARIISIYRNPLDAVSSWREHPRFIRKGVMDLDYYYGGSPEAGKERTYMWRDLLDCIARYRCEHSLMLRWAEKHQICAVRYEDLLKNPEEETKKIFTYLDIPFTRTVFTEQAGFQPWGDPAIVSDEKKLQGIDSENTGLFRKRLTAGEILLVKRLTADIARREQYEPEEYEAEMGGEEKYEYRKFHPEKPCEAVNA